MAIAFTNIGVIFEVVAHPVATPVMEAIELPKIPQIHCIVTTSSGNIRSHQLGRWALAQR